MCRGADGQTRAKGFPAARAGPAANEASPSRDCGREAQRVTAAERGRQRGWGSGREGMGAGGYRTRGARAPARLLGLRCTQRGTADAEAINEHSRRIHALQKPVDRLSRDLATCPRRVFPSRALAASSRPPHRPPTPRAHQLCPYPPQGECQHHNQNPTARTLPYPHPHRHYRPGPPTWPRAHLFLPARARARTPHNAHSPPRTRVLLTASLAGARGPRAGTGWL